MKKLKFKYYFWCAVFCVLMVLGMLLIPFYCTKDDALNEVLNMENETTTSQQINSSVSKLSESRTVIYYYTQNDIEDIAKLLLKECGGVSSQTEQACVVWCVLNRVDTSDDSIYNVLREAGQFAFDENAEIREDLYNLSYDVLQRWNREKNGETSVGRVLPKEYLFFEGDGTHNYFRNSFDGEYTVWDYGLESPYIT